MSECGFPVMLDLRARRAVVVGLGRVGRRKAASLVAAGAYVMAVEPRLVPSEPGVIVIAEAFRPAHLDGFSIAMAAATPEVNRSVVEAARTRGIWVNSASDPEQGDILVPASLHLGRLTLSVSTDGAGPAAARSLRDLVSGALPAGVEEWLELIAEQRTLVKETVSDPEARRRLFLEWSAPEWAARVAAEGVDAIRSLWEADRLAVLAEGRARPGEH